MTDLSLLIPARNEMFLSRTIDDLLAHAESDFEIIAVLDGEWAEPAIVQHPRVTVIHYPESIGQRAATNAAARIASGKYVAKVDAHCAFAQGFDRVLLEDMQPDWTIVPIMRNLHVFNWVCKNGHSRYQGPSGPCKECGEPTEMDIVWIAKTNPQSTSYCFDPTPHFQYFGDFRKRPEGKGDLTETMSLQGSFFMLSRDKYFELGMNDESWGSWGTEGFEIAVKTWLSGGKCIVNHKTWYAHLFRTQGDGFGFPYPISGRQVDHAKKTAHDIFFNNKWDKQTKPLSWLVKKFWPVNGWKDDDLSRLLESEISISHLRPELFGSLGVVGVVPSAMADHTTPMTIDGSGKQMTIPAMGLSSLPSSSTIPQENILGIGDQSQVSGVTTGTVTTNMIDNGNVATLTNRDRAIEHGVHEPVSSIKNLVDSNFPISVGTGISSPVPASSIGIDTDSGENLISLPVGKSGNCEIIDVSHSIPPSKVSSRLESERATTRSGSIILPSAGIVYYTDNRLDEHILHACQEQLLKSANGIPIISVSLQPLDFGTRNIVLPLERGYLTMFKQILTGLEALDSDIVFFCEHDVLYHPSHFAFQPAHQNIYYYNINVWKLRLPDGHLLHYDCQQTSGLCAYRELLLQHYRERVRRVEISGYSRNMGFEPGTHGRPERIDDYKARSWRSEYPNIDIRHKENLTPSRWSKEQFRNQRFTAGWAESGEVPDWGKGTEIIRQFS